MYKYKIIVTPSFASKMLRIRLRDFLSCKSNNTIKYEIAPWRGYAIDSNSITITVESKNNLSEMSYEFTALDEFFEETLLLDTTTQFYLEKHPILMTLIDDN